MSGLNTVSNSQMDVDIPNPREEETKQSAPRSAQSSILPFLNVPVKPSSFKILLFPNNNENGRRKYELSGYLSVDGRFQTRIYMDTCTGKDGVSKYFKCDPEHIEWSELKKYEAKRE
jgi:hypothetical protein